MEDTRLDILINDMREVKLAIKELVSATVENGKLQAVHNHQLATHEARSLELQRRQDVLNIEIDTRLEPLETRQRSSDFAVKVFLSVVAAAASLAAIYHYVIS